MQPYSVLAAEVACESQIAVQVLLSQDNSDLEFIMVQPRQGPYISAESFTDRQLRSVGVIGLNGLKPLCAFKEPLGAQLIAKISAAFCEYIRVLLGSTFAEQAAYAIAQAEISEMERMFALPDPRTYPHPRVN